MSQWVPMGRGEEEQQGSLGEHFGRGAQKSCGRQLEKLGLSVQPSPLQSCGGQGGGPLGQREGRPASGGWKTKDSVRKVPCPVNRRGYSHLTYTRRYCAWFNFSSVRESWEIGQHGQTREGGGEDAVCPACGLGCELELSVLSSRDLRLLWDRRGCQSYASQHCGFCQGRARKPGGQRSH